MSVSPTMSSEPAVLSVPRSSSSVPAHGANPSAPVETVKKAEVTQLTGLRALAAWSVVLFHSGYMLQPLSNSIFRLTRAGYLGVDVFFVLSGFVIAYNYMDGSRRSGGKGWREFFWMRFARLYPVHLFTLLVSLLLYLTVRMAALHTVKDFSGWTARTFIANVFMVHAWLPHPHDSWNNASWSISCEWFAYLLFPLIVYAGVRRISPRMGLVIASLAATAPALILWIKNDVPFFNLIEVSFEFAAGCLIYVSFKSLRGNTAVRYAAGGLVLAGTLMLMALHDLKIGVGARWAVSLFPLLVMYIAVSTGVVRRILCSRLLVYWGKASYSLYMTHNLTLWSLKYFLPNHDSVADAARYVIYLLTIAVVAMLTYHFVEEPARKALRAVITRSGTAAVPVLT